MKGKSMKKQEFPDRRCFQFLSYEVWGNAKDGWEVNDLISMGWFIVVDDFKGPIETLFKKAAKKLVMRPRFRVNLDWLDDTMVEMTRPSGHPLGRFQEVKFEDVGGKWGLPGAYRDAQVIRITRLGRMLNETGKWR